MTEAAHQMASNPLPPGARKPGSVGLAAGPEIAIMDEDGRLLARGAVGRDRHPRAQRHAGYEDNPEANAAAFHDGWFRTGDQGVLDADGYLCAHRPAEGDHQPRRREDLAARDRRGAARTSGGRPGRDLRRAAPSLGEDVAAAVVLRPGAAVTDAELRRFAAGRLAYFKVPRRIVILDEIPKGPTGKPQRVGLAQILGFEGKGDQAGRPAAGGASPTPPRNELEEALVAVWAEFVCIEAGMIGIDRGLLELGGDSLAATRLLNRVRDAGGDRGPAGRLLHRADGGRACRAAPLDADRCGGG